MIACGSTPSPTAPPTTVVAIVGLTATVEPITTPATGILYRLTYQVHESGGQLGATLMTQHFALSNGAATDGAINSSPHVAAGATITIQSTLSILTTAPPATHVVFTIGYTDDNGRVGSVSAEADVARIGGL